MITKEFAEAVKELNTILEFAPSEYVEKIPLKLRELFKEVESKEYTPNIDPYKELDKQDLLPKTKDLITVMYRNYWCTPEEREKLDKILIENDRKYEAELREKYNPDDIFKKKNVDVSNKDNQNSIGMLPKDDQTKEISNLPVAVKENIFTKIIRLLKNIFKKN